MEQKSKICETSKKWGRQLCLNNRKIVHENLTTFRQYVQGRGVPDVATLNVLQQMETHCVMTTLAASN